MYKKVTSASLRGIDGYLVSVEVDVSEGFPSFNLVGLPDSSIKEAIERVRTSIKNTSITFPYKRITVNLSPADIKKEGSYFDLPIALGILACTEEIQEKSLESTLVLGELSLNGELRRVNGILPMMEAACKEGYKSCIIPKDNVAEASVVEGLDIIGASDLKEVISFLNADSIIIPEKPVLSVIQQEDTYKTDENNFKDIMGQEAVKRALEIAASGMHNVLIIGEPGSGKTLMAKCIPSILPNLTFEESFELTKIYSVAGQMKKNQAMIKKRPFRSPHHTISQTALTGGGTIPKPGEISLANKGVLFLDELPEFQKNVIEVLRQPLEDNEITLSRSKISLSYPADFMLVCSMNPCPCGYYPDNNRCSCTPLQIKNYLGKISGPLLDRIDIHITANKIEFDKISEAKDCENSEDVRKRVVKTHQIQMERIKKASGYFNAGLNISQIKKYCTIKGEALELIKNAFEKLGLSARAYHRILKVARTIADMEESEEIEAKHIAEAISYRTLDRKYWMYS